MLNNSPMPDRTDEHPEWRGEPYSNPRDREPEYHGTYAARCLEEALRHFDTFKPSK